MDKEYFIKVSIKGTEIKREISDNIEDLSKMDLIEQMEIFITELKKEINL